MGKDLFVYKTYFIFYYLYLSLKSRDQLSVSTLARLSSQTDDSLFSNQTPQNFSPAWAKLKALSGDTVFGKK